MTDALLDRVAAAVGDAYRVEAEVGRGGFAVVYRATDVRLKRPVAIKVLPPDLAFRDDVRRRFLREAQLAAQLSHPNIVPIYAVDERGGLVYFVMAFVDGESLAMRLLRGPLSIADARRILHDVADALVCAHAHGVVHRDVKPDNILLEREGGRPLVTDFGIARAAEADSRLTVTGIAVGTPAYMSPEQALGEHEVDGRSDIYGLGVVGYQMLAGELPFRAGNTAAMMMKHISEAPRPLRDLRADVPPPLEQAIARALAKRPEDRWPDAGAFRDAVMRDDRASLPWQHAAAPVRVGAVRAPATAPAAPAGAQPAVAGVGVPQQQVAGAVPDAWRWGSPPWPPAGPLSSRDAWRAYFRYQKHGWRHEVRRMRDERFNARPIDERIRIFRRNLASTGIVVGVLAGINVVTTPWFPWFIFAALGLGAPVIRQWSGLWADGVSWKRIFERRPPEALPAAVGPGQSALPPSPSAAEQAAAKIAPREVLAGPYGDTVRRAAADGAAILSVVDTLGKADRELIPDVVPTVNALMERVGSIAQMLHHLDADASPGALAQLERRIAEIRAEPEDAIDRERRLSLLERQQTSLRQLAARRQRLTAQLESVGIALQNLKLDLMKLRASGVQAAMAEVNSATVEARALSRDIAHVLDAAEEVRKIQS